MALERFRKRFGERIVQNLPINPLPASWEIQVKDANQVDAVAAKFFDDPAVDNDPAPTTGSSTPRRRCARCSAPSA